MLDVIFISNYWHFDFEKSSSRYLSLANLAVDNGFRIELVTSTFYHTRKAHRDVSKVQTSCCRYRVTLLSEPGYSSNVSIQRLVSHHIFTNNVLRYLKKRSKPDVIYLFVPPTYLAQKIVAFSNKYSIKVIIDIQDLWPDAFQMLFASPITDFVLFPMRKQIYKAYEGADEIIAVSNSYLESALVVNQKCTRGHSVYIGTDIQLFDDFAKNAAPLEGKIRSITLVYIGMLGHSYDLISTMNALYLLQEQGFDNVEFLIMGDGPLQKKFEDYSREKHLPVRFTGRLSYDDMVKRLVCCDIAINPIRRNAMQSIINKHADYLTAGLPIINMQQQNEFNQLLDTYQAGINCPVGDVYALAKAIHTLASDTHLRESMGKNSRRLAEEKFDRNKTYHEIINLFF